MSIASIISADVAARPIPSHLPQPALPDQEDLSVTDADLIGHAEGQSFGIEYLDSAGRASQRFITVWSIVAGSDGIPCLLAHCHTRKMHRQFRVDRIQRCFDYDGVLHEDVAQFLCDNFGMAPEIARRGDSSSPERWQQILNLVKTEATLLAALSRIDGNVCLAEVQVASDYLADVAALEGITLAPAEVLGISGYLKRLRPTEAAINRALEHMRTRAPERIMHFLVATVKTVDADGRRHPSERRLINMVAEELTGLPIM